MIGGILKKLFGDKGQKDLKELQPFVEAANVEHAKLGELSNDELRAITPDLKAKIANGLKEIDAKISELKKKAADANTLIDEKEQMFQEIETLEKESDVVLEEVLLEILPQAFAVVKETAKRFTENEKVEVTANDFDKEVSEARDNVEIVGDKAFWNKTWDASGTEVIWNMIHYDVQLLGGTALHKGKIAEMQTGEGKTLVATLPVYLNALSGKGVHLITVNDYLARRDALWMGPIYQFHGLTVDCIDNHEPHSPGRIKAYNADIVFGTNNEFGFDYLRDNMVSEPGGLVQRKHHYAIIDEVDSVLVDDARTPLIISGPTPKGDEHEFNELKPKIEKLVAAQRKLVTTLITEAKSKLAKGNAEGGEKKETKKNLEEGGLALLRSFRGLPKNKAIIKYLSEPGMRAQLQKTENYYLQDNAKEMPKADELLYFVIDEKNNTIDLTEKGIDLISGAEDPEFYILPDIGLKMTEIEESTPAKDQQLKLKDAMITDYTVKAERIHSINQLLKAYSLFEIDVEYVVMDNKVKIVDEQTGRIMDGRRYSDGLHQAIEAKENVKVEAASQTYATITLQNYFRMYHKLAGMTGTAETEAKELWDIYELDVVVVPTNRPIQRIDKQDLVYKTAREKYSAIIDEVEALRNAGRPVLVGTTNVEISELVSRMLNMKKIPHQVLNAKLHQKEADVVRAAGEAGTVTIATNMAGRGTDIILGGNPSYKTKQQVQDYLLNNIECTSQILSLKNEIIADYENTKGLDVLKKEIFNLPYSLEQANKTLKSFYKTLFSKNNVIWTEENKKVLHLGGLFVLGTERHETRRIDNQLRGRSGRQGDPGISQFFVSLEDELIKVFGGDSIKRWVEFLVDDKDSPLESGLLTKSLENAQQKVELYNYDLRKNVFQYDDVLNSQRKQLFNARNQILSENTYQTLFLRYLESLFDEEVDTLSQKKIINREDINLRLEKWFGVYSTSFMNQIVTEKNQFYKEIWISYDLRFANTNLYQNGLLKSTRATTILSIIDFYWTEHIERMSYIRETISWRSYGQQNPLIEYNLEAFSSFKLMFQQIRASMIYYFINNPII